MERPKHRQGQVWQPALSNLPTPSETRTGNGFAGFLLPVFARSFMNLPTPPLELGVGKLFEVTQLFVGD